MNILKSKIKNTFMSIKDLYKKWTSLSDHGYKMINEIINIKLRKEYIGSEHMEDFNQFEDLENIIESKINKDVNDKINNINEYMDKFVNLYDKSYELLTQLENLMYEYEEDIIMREPLLFSLSFQSLLYILKDIFSMFSKDLVMKKLVIDQIEKVSNRNTLVMYTYSWMENPMIQRKVIDEKIEIIEHELSIASS